MTNKFFIKNGSSFNPCDDANMEVINTLPAGTYIVKQRPHDGPLYFDRTDDFSISGKVYGDLTSNSERFMNTFQDRDCNTGILLSGEKGSGKTMLAKKVCIDGIENGYPVILINNPWFGEAFNELMDSITTPAIVLFDEFEKVYDREFQDHILTLLDGTSTTKKMYILTCNNIYGINSYMKNRPGRIFYALEYNGIETDFIREYCEDNLNNKEHIESVCRLSVMYSSFNFDMLKAVVEEMNRYGEDPSEAVKLLNMNPTTDGNDTFTVTLLDKDYKKIPVCQHNSTLRINAHPLDMHEAKLYFYPPDDDNNNKTSLGNFASVTSYKDDFYDMDCMAMPTTSRDHDNINYYEYIISSSDIIDMDSSTGNFIAKTDNPDHFVQFARKAYEYFDFNKMI